MSKQTFTFQYRKQLSHPFYRRKIHKLKKYSISQKKITLYQSFFTPKNSAKAFRYENLQFQHTDYQLITSKNPLPLPPFKSLQLVLFKD